MNAADILILAVLAASMLFGLMRGLVSEVLSLVAWVAAFWVAWAFGGEVALFYGAWLANTTACIIAGYISCFLGVVVLGALAGYALRKLMDGGGMRGGDRLLGMLFGLARGAVLVTFVVLLLGFTAVPRQATWWQQSLLIPAFSDAAGWFAHELPPQLTARLNAGGKALPALGAIPISALSRLATPATTESAASASTTAARARAHGHQRGDVGQ